MVGKWPSGHIDDARDDGDAHANSSHSTVLSTTLGRTNRFTKKTFVKSKSKLFRSFLHHPSLGHSRVTVTALAAVLLGGTTHISQAQTTGFNKTAGGTYDYNDTSNWVGGTINGIWDSSLTLTGAQTIQFAANTTLSTALDFQCFGSQNILLQGTGGAKTITLGGDITSNVSINKAVTIGSATAANNLNVDLGGVTRTFTAGSSKSLNFINVVSNGAVTTYGGTVSFSGANTYTGNTTANSGILALNGASGSASNSDFTVNAITSSTALQFNSTTSGNTGTTRAKSVTLNGAGNSSGATLTASGNATANSNDVITNALTASEGSSIVGVTANAARNARLSAGSFSREAGSSILFRGSNLGVNSLASLTAGVANISFTSGPTLSGSGSAGTSTVGIISGAYGDSTAGGTGSGLVTYDSTYGVRLLSGSEYKTSITDGQSTLDNIRLANSAGTGVVTTTLGSATTVNSLSLAVSGADAVSGSGITIGGTGSLKLNSGAIYASQLVTGQATGGNAANAMTLSVASIDLNGQEGSVIVFTNGVNNGNTAAPLTISSVISNDGGNGVTFGGNGETILTGSAANTYTGVTTLNGGILRLNKSVANIGLTTDLIMNGGTLLKTSNAIADTASVTINGGSFVMDTTTSSGNNSHQETIANFTMNGGSFSNHGKDAALTVTGNATLAASELAMNQGGDITVSGSTNLTGGVLRSKESSSTTVFNALTSLNTLNITNTASGAYTSIILNSHATNKGAQLTLNGDVTFTGNGANSNTVKINSSDAALANQGVIALNGTRTFTIGNGAAADDLTIESAVTDGTSTGGLIKTGLGTLALTGANTYTGPTTVTGGELNVNGSVGGTVAVSSGAKLTGAGTISGATTISSGGIHTSGDSVTLANNSGAGTIGKQTFTNGITYNQGSIFEWNLTGNEETGIGTRGSNYDAVNAASLATTGTEAIFRVVLNADQNFDEAFWNADRTWSNIFTNLAGTDSLNIEDIFSGTVQYWNSTGEIANANGTRSFSISGTSLTWSAVPEPTSALAGLLLTAGLLRRRRRV